MVPGVIWGVGYRDLLWKEGEKRNLWDGDDRGGGEKVRVTAKKGLCVRKSEAGEGGGCFALLSEL